FLLGELLRLHELRFRHHDRLGLDGDLLLGGGPSAGGRRRGGWWRRRRGQEGDLEERRRQLLDVPERIRDAGGDQGTVERDRQRVPEPLAAGTRRRLCLRAKRLERHVS